MNLQTSRCFWHLAVSDIHWKVMVATVLAQATAKHIELRYSFPPRQAAMLRHLANKAQVRVLPLEAGTPIAMIRSLQIVNDSTGRWWIGDYTPHPEWVNSIAETGIFAVLLGSHWFPSGYSWPELPQPPDGWGPYYTGSTVLSCDLAYTNLTRKSRSCPPRECVAPAQ
jgi:hypothetical protein